MVYPRDPETVKAIERLTAAVSRLEAATVKLWREITEYVEQLRKFNGRKR